MAKDPVTGPFSREEFAKLVSAPFGEALKEIRKYDPLWGRTAGEKIKWRIVFSRQITERAEKIVEAQTLEEAEKLSDKIEDRELDWDVEDTDMSTVELVEPLS